jgi:CubicO group peptidase (beta-lactamase class C family)
MKKFKFFFSILFLSFGSFVLNAQSLTQQQITAIETAIQDEMKTAKTPGVSIAIINNNKIVYEKWFGIANSLTKTPLTDSTVFQIASVTKIFTSLALLTELKKAGIGIEAPIGDLIKGLSPELSQVTYHQLLSHTSGMINYWPTPNEYNKDVYTFFKNVGDSVLFTKPGEVFSYSNTGYALAGLALEKLTNKPYTEAINDIILKPLKLTSTSFNFYIVACGSFSAGHSFNNNSGVMLPYIMNHEYPLLQAAGGIFSNIRDLERFAMCLMNQGELEGQKIFDKEIIEKMSMKYARNFIVSVPPFGYWSLPNNAYGYGLFTFDYGNLKFIGNAGSTSQMTYFIYEPEKKFALIIISNCEIDWLINSFKKIFEVVLGEKEQSPIMYTVNRSEWKDITGKYILHALEKKNESWLDILEKEGKLFINVSNTGEIEMEQIGGLTYKFTNPAFRFPVEVSFDKDKSGEVTYIRYMWESWQKVK